MVYGADGSLWGEVPRVRRGSTKVKGETMTPQVGEGVNEGDMEVCRAREKSEAKQGG